MRVEYDPMDPSLGFPDPVDQWLPALPDLAAIKVAGVDGSLKNLKTETSKSQ